MPARINLLSWNVAGRVALHPEQAAGVARREPDVVCLQEVRASTAPRWRRALADAGLTHNTRARRKHAHRLDHVLASASLCVAACDYVHGWREAGLSDHSAIEARF